MKFILKRFSNYLKLRQKKVLASNLFKDLGRDVIKAFFKNYRYAASLSLLQKVKTINIKLSPKIVVEFGTGTTTMILAKTLSPGGQIISLDQHNNFLRNTKSLIKDLSLVTFVYPKIEGKIDYSFLYSNREFNFPADLVIIDGPTGERFAHEAQAAFDTIIGKNTVCIIDDTDRKDIDINAKSIAIKNNLKKYDYKDPIYDNQQYAVLLPFTLSSRELFEEDTC